MKRAPLALPKLMRTVVRNKASEVLFRVRPYPGNPGTSIIEINYDVGGYASWALPDQVARLALLGAEKSSHYTVTEEES